MTLLRRAAPILVWLSVVGGRVGSAAEAQPRVRTGDIDFDRHVSSLLGVLGCNAAACHGSFQGRGGFRLSLFSHDPELDYRSLTRDSFGRRVQPSDPDRSLILLKATGAVPHGGGKRLDRNAWQYEVIRAWIAAGCPRSLKGADVARIAIEPGEVVLTKSRSAALKVTVDFTDGSREDVTPYCRFRAQDETVADVSALGEVRGLGPGETAIVASYKGHWAHASAIVPAHAAPGFEYPAVAESNYIDREVFAKLRRLNVIPSDLSSDEEFLRRLTIDVVGRLPTPAEVRAFLADKRAGKRAATIDRMLADLDHASLWATRFCDITACNQDTMEGPPEMTAKRAKMWHDWFRRRVADNMPYDRIVHGVLCATSRDGQDVGAWIRRETALAGQASKGFETSYADRESLDLFWRRFAGDEFFPLEQMAELTATAFMGIRIECAQCHKHPFDRWTQSDYRAYANVFGKVRFGYSIEASRAIADILDQRRKSGSHGPPLPRIQEIYGDPQRQRVMLRPDSADMLPPTAPGGPTFDDRADCREQLFRWLVQPDNPYFARSFVNRVWAHYMGRGLVEPVDQFSADNPASNEPLLAALARDFVDHRYDLRRLERTILNSRTYQLSSRPNDSNRTDRTHRSHARVRPMLAEVVVDVLDGALGREAGADSAFAPASRAIEIAGNRVKPPHLARIFKVFGRPARTTQCDCERLREPTIGQALFLMSDERLLRQIETGRLKGLLAGERTDDEILEELFLATLSRFPDEAERKSALEHVRSAGDRAAGFRDVVWSLINTREFILNH